MASFHEIVFNTLRTSGVSAAKRIVAQNKAGHVAEVWNNGIEIEFVRYRLSQNDSAETILQLIRQTLTDFSIDWNLAKIHKIRVKMNRPVEVPPALQSQSGDFFNINPNRGWGVEIEMISRLSKREVAARLESAGIRIVVNSRGARAYRHKDWKMTEDGSLSHGGMELVSPVLKGEPGLAELAKVCAVLKECKCRIDVSCGLHVHHQVETSGVDDLKILQNAMYIYHKYQNNISSMLPKSRRFNDACHPHSTSEIRTAFEYRDAERLVRHSERRRAVNVQAYERHGTCEFRQHSGSIEADKIGTWVIITQSIMIKAIELARMSSDIEAYKFKKSLIEEMKFQPSVKAYIENRIAKVA